MLLAAACGDNLSWPDAVVAIVVVIVIAVVFLALILSD